MPRRLKLTEPLSVDELEQRYRQSRHPIEQTHFQMLWLFASGKTTEEVAAVTGYSRHWIRQLVARYNQQGPQGRGDRRHHNPGGRWLLSEEQKADLDQALTQPPDDGGLWSGPKVAAWMIHKTGRSVSPQRGWDYLRLLGYTRKIPRPYKADAEDTASL